MAIIELDEIQGNTALNVKLSKNLEDDEMELSYGGSKIQSLLQCITLFTDNSFTDVSKLDVNNFTVTLASSIIVYKHSYCDKEVSKITFRAKNGTVF
uniref:Uncharacterized protein n=1 Tax=Panagrolaimus sp. ES5 TaxID=591445 RepID=A0AC34G3M3_9BILA